MSYMGEQAGFSSSGDPPKETHSVGKFSRSAMLGGMGAAVALGPHIVRAQTLEKIRISAVPTDDMTPIFYAIKNGLYAKGGLDVEVIPVSSGSASTAAVVSGAYELGKGSPLASLFANQRGLPIVIVANGAVWNPKSPFNLVLVAADSPIKSGADCNGKIGSAPGLNDVAQLGVLQWVDKTGGDSKTMKWVEIPNSAAGVALAEDRVDVTTLNEPQLTAAVETGRVRAIGDAFTAIAERWAASVYFTHTDYVAKHADAVKKWVRVTYDTAAYTNSHKAETVPLMSEITKIPSAVFQKMARIEGATTSDPSLVQPVIDLAARYKNIPRAFPAKSAYWSG